jgi:hypothetical protein
MIIKNKNLPPRIYKLQPVSFLRFFFIFVRNIDLAAVGLKGVLI